MDHRHDYDISARDAHLAGLLTRRHYHPRLTRAEKADLASGLAVHPLTAGMTQAEIRALIDVSHPFSYPAHWTISAQSTCADLCFLILEGTVAMTRNRRESRIVGPGDAIGLVDASHHHLHSETAVSRTQVSGIAVDAAPLLEALGAHGLLPGRQAAVAPTYEPAGAAV